MTTVGTATAAPAETAETKLPGRVVLTTSKEHVVGFLAGEVVKEAYRRIGITAVVQLLPNRRSLLHSSTGLVDGEVGRAAGIEKRFPDLIRVPTPIQHIDSVVYARGPRAPVKGWSGLKGIQVAIVRGEYHSERGTAGLDVVRANDYRQLFSMLDRGRVQIAVGLRVDGTLMLRSEPAFSKIRLIEPPLSITQVHHYVHRKNRSLVPRLDAQLQKMAQAGEIEAITRRAFETVLAGRKAARR